MLKRSLVLAALCGMSFAATAVTIDLRHEFIDGGKSDKIMLTASPFLTALPTA